MSILEMLKDLELIDHCPGKRRQLNLRRDICVKTNSGGF